jgi:uncharacterized membrane protein YgcG
MCHTFNHCLLPPNVRIQYHTLSESRCLISIRKTVLPVMPAVASSACHCYCCRHAQPLSELTPSDSERLITVSGGRDKVLRAVALILNTVRRHGLAGSYASSSDGSIFGGGSSSSSSSNVGGSSSSHLVEAASGPATGPQTQQQGRQQRQWKL